MLLESGLAVMVILACAAGLGAGVYDYDADLGRYVSSVGDAGTPLMGEAAWAKYYGAGDWASMTLPKKIGGFIEGGANMMAAIGVPVTMGIGIMAVLVASFAATTLDTATRLQRYVITEVGQAVSVAPLTNRYVATGVAVITGGAIALIAGPAGPGSGGLILWPIFGAVNQLLAGLAFLVVCFYLIRHNRPIWFLVPPMLLLLIVPAWVLVVQIFGEGGWLAGGRYLLVALGLAAGMLEVWMVIEGVLMYRQAKGVAPEPLPELRRGIPA